MRNWTRKKPRHSEQFHGAAESQDVLVPEGREGAEGPWEASVKGSSLGVKGGARSLRFYEAWIHFRSGGRTTVLCKEM